MPKIFESFRKNPRDLLGKLKKTKGIWGIGKKIPAKIRPRVLEIIAEMSTKYNLSAIQLVIFEKLGIKVSRQTVWQLRREHANSQKQEIREKILEEHGKPALGTLLNLFEKGQQAKPRKKLYTKAANNMNKTFDLKVKKHKTRAEIKRDLGISPENVTIYLRNLYNSVASDETKKALMPVRFAREQRIAAERRKRK